MFCHDYIYNSIAYLRLGFWNGWCNHPQLFLWAIITAWFDKHSAKKLCNACSIWNIRFFRNDQLTHSALYCIAVILEFKIPERPNHHYRQMSCTEGASRLLVICRRLYSISFFFTCVFDLLLSWTLVRAPICNIISCVYMKY